MVLLSRIIPALSLALVLTVASLGSVFAMGPQMGADGSIVICNGSGLVTITTGTGESETEYVLLCPDCVPHQIATAPLFDLDLAAPETFQFAETSLRVSAPTPLLGWRSVQARAPPFV